MTVYEKIDAQVEGKEYTPVWGVAQQLKDILRGDPSLEGMVDKDLDVKGMSLADCEKKIKARADAIHKEKGLKGVCIPPQEAEKIIREFYGLPEMGTEKLPQAAGSAASPLTSAGAEGAEDVLDLADFF